MFKLAWTLFLWMWLFLAIVWTINNEGSTQLQQQLPGFVWALQLQPLLTNPNHHCSCGAFGNQQQLPLSHCLNHPLVNRQSSSRRRCSVMKWRRRRQDEEQTETIITNNETTSKDVYSLGLRPFRTTKPDTSNTANDADTNHTTTTTATFTDNITTTTMMEQNEAYGQIAQWKTETDQQQQVSDDMTASFNSTSMNDRQALRPSSLSSTTTNDSSSSMDYALHANQNNAPSSSASTLDDSSEKDSSFFKSWKYQPIQTTTSSSSPTSTANTTHNNESNHTTLESLESDKFTANNTKTSPVTDNRDIASFFQSWRYQPVTTSSSNKNQTPPATTTIPPPTLVNPNQTVLVTIADLQEYLRSQGYIRQSDLPTTTAMIPKTTSPKLSSSSSSSLMSRSSGGGSSSSSTIAFPQKTVMKLRDLRVACILCASSLAAMLATTVWPNLWLVGGMTGGFYGSRVAVAYANATATAQQPLDATGPLLAVEGAPTSYAALAILYLGRRLAQVYLYLAWVSQTLWFLYKTGQLSLEYYKQYAVLDDKFQIQSKLDTINARFVQAKLDFDAWEKENEIGRKVLATLRTAWYIEEQSFAKRQRQAAREARYRRSRYRIVQFGWDVYFWMLHVLERIWNFATTGRANTWRGWTEFWNGVARDLKEAMTSSDQWGSRLGAVVVAWMAVNAIGAMFAISPSLLNLSAVLFAVLWPSWMSEVVDRADSWLEEVKAKGRDSKLLLADEEQDRSIMDPTWEWIQTVVGGGPVPATTSSSLSSSSSSASSKPFLNLFLFRRYDKNRYHYYRRADGTRRFYRTGNPLFGRPHVGATTAATAASSSSSSKKTLSTSRLNQKRTTTTTQESWRWPWNKNEQDQQRRKRNKGRKEDPGREQWSLFGGGGD